MPALIFGVLMLVLALWALNVISKVDPQNCCTRYKNRRRPAFARTCSLLGLAWRGRRRHSARRFWAWVARLGAVWRLQALGRARRRRRDRRRACVRRILRWNSIMTAASMRGRVIRRPSPGRRAGRARRRDFDLDCSPRSTRKAAPYLRLILTAGIPAGVSTRKRMRQRGGAATAGGKMTEEEAYQILGLEPRCERQRHRPRAPHAYEETASRPGGLDVSRGPYQRGQGNPSSPSSLRYSTNATISGSWFSTSLLFFF